MGETIDKVLAEADLDQDELRAAVREAIAEDGATVAGFARSAGGVVATFAAWLNGTYAGNNVRQAQLAKTYLASRAAKVATRAQMPQRSAFVLTPSAKAFMQLLSQAQYAPDMVTLVGVPGVGKTEAAREYARRNSNVFMLTASPMMRGPYALLSALSDVMGVREASPLRQPRAIANMIRGKTPLIIIDEAQHVGMQALDQIRSLHDDPDVQCGIALLGNHDVRARMAGGGKHGAHAQLDSRFGAHINRKSTLVGDINALLDAEGIVGEEERKLLRAVAGKPGALRKMCRVLRLARVMASGQEAECLSIEHITAALQQMSDLETGV